MTFPCGFCGVSPPPRTKQEKVVTEIRIIGKGRVKMINNTTADYINPPWEIATEVSACPACAMKHKDMKPKVVDKPKLSDISNRQ